MAQKVWEVIFYQTSYKPLSQSLQYLTTGDMFRSMMISSSLMFSSSLLVPFNWQPKHKTVRGASVFTSALTSHTTIHLQMDGGEKWSCSMASHLQPTQTWPLAAGRRLGPLPQDTLSSVPLWSSPGAWSRSVHPDSVQCCQWHSYIDLSLINAGAHSNKKCCLTKL